MTVLRCFCVVKTWSVNHYSAYADYWESVASSQCESGRTGTVSELRTSEMFTTTSELVVNSLF